MKNLALTIVTVVTMISCKDSDREGTVENLEVEAKQATIDSMKMEMEKQRIIDSMKAVSATVARPVEKEVVVVNQAPAKKKWSGAAKGAVIGAGVGAVTGAIVSDKKGEGAIIGGLAGAGVGAGTGAIIDESKK
ncbi:glycine zipper family protein [Flavobacterium sp. GCM10023249]|uniref:glycine zipper family protein n=1 Tax=unclassified Flavobacterium TaxID=196869 RepID=UPI00361D3747